MDVLYGVITVAYPAMLLWTKAWAARLGMPQLKAWNAPGEGREAAGPGG